MYKLLDSSLESSYWMGFLLADGHFNEKKGCINLNLNIKDIDHTKKLLEYLGLNNKITIKDNSCKVTINNKAVVKCICDKYNINSNKTIYPPSILYLKYLNIYSLISLIIGFIDGDGHIRIKKVYKNIRVGVHKNWSDILLLFNDILYSYFNQNVNIFNLRTKNKNRVRLYNKSITVDDNIITRYISELYIDNIDIINGLYNFINEHGLPALKRKWDIVK